MIWGLAILALLGFVLAIGSHSPGWMALGIAIALICGVAAALLFIDRHLRASSRPEHMTEREIEALRNTLHKDRKPPRQLPPSGQP